MEHNSTLDFIPRFITPRVGISFNPLIPLSRWQRRANRNDAINSPMTNCHETHTQSPPATRQIPENKLNAQTLSTTQDMNNLYLLFLGLVASSCLTRTAADEHSWNGRRSLNGGYCAGCTSNCSECSCGACKACSHGYYLEEHECRKCYGCEDIEGCSWCECSTCKECLPGYKLNKWGLCDKDKCDSCGDRCYECDCGKCKSCKSGYYLNDHWCEECKKCSEGCDDCSCGKCKSCKHGYYLKDNWCKGCGHCDKSCHDCDCGTCKGCGDGYHLQDGKCYECAKCSYGCESCHCGYCHECEHGYSLEDGACSEIHYEEAPTIQYIEVEPPAHTYAPSHPAPYHPVPSIRPSIFGGGGSADAKASCFGPNCVTNTETRSGAGYSFSSSSSSSNG